MWVQASGSAARLDAVVGRACRVQFRPVRGAESWHVGALSSPETRKSHAPAPWFSTGESNPRGSAGDFVMSLARAAA